MPHSSTTILLLLLDAGVVVVIAAAGGVSNDWDGPLTLLQTFLVAGLFGFVGTLIGVASDGTTNPQRLARESLGNFGVSLVCTPLTVVKVSQWTGLPCDIALVAPIATLYALTGMLIVRQWIPALWLRFKRRSEQEMDARLGVKPQPNDVLLIVDDDAHWRLLLKRYVAVFCRENHLEAIVVANLDEASGYVDRARYLVTDWRMGEAAMADIVAVERFVRALGIPTLIVTGASASVTLQPSRTISVIDKRIESEPLPTRIFEELERLKRGDEPVTGLRPA